MEIRGLPLDSMMELVNSRLSRKGSASLFETLSELKNSDAVVSDFSAKREFRNVLRDLAVVLRSDEELLSLHSSSKKDAAESLFQGESFSLELTTREGDVFKVNIGTVSSDEEEGEGSADLAIEIEGDLSKEERSALADLIEESINLSDDFFASEATFDFGTLGAFNSKYLSAVSADLVSGRGGQVSLDYEVDSGKKQQQLAVNFRIGKAAGEFEVRSGFGQSDAAAMQNTLDLIDRGAAIAYQNEDKAQGRHIAEVFRAGFSTMIDLADKLGRAEENAAGAFRSPLSLASDLFRKTIQSDPRYRGLANDEKARLDAGISSIVDYSAKFKTEEGGGKEKTGTPTHGPEKVRAGFSLQVSSKSEVSEDSPERVKQTREYSLLASYSGLGRIESINERESYTAQLFREKDGLSLSQSRERAQDNYLRAYVGAGEALKKTEEFEEKAQGAAATTGQAFLESNTLERKGRAFHGVVAYRTLLAGGYHSLDHKEQTTHLGIRLNIPS